MGWRDEGFSCHTKVIMTQEAIVVKQNWHPQTYSYLWALHCDICLDLGPYDCTPERPLQHYSALSINSPDALSVSVPLP